jgi:hypothetical protein
MKGKPSFIANSKVDLIEVRVRSPSCSIAFELETVPGGKRMASIFQQEVADLPKKPKKVPLCFRRSLV